MSGLRFILFPGKIVISPACGVGKCVVSVVYLLELLGADAALGGVRGDAVRMVLKG